MIHVGRAPDINDFGNIGKVEVVITPDEHDAFGAVGVDLGQAGEQLGVGGTGRKRAPGDQRRRDRDTGADGAIIVDTVMVPSRISLVDSRPVMAPKVDAQLIKYQ